MVFRIATLSTLLIMLTACQNVRQDGIDTYNGSFLIPQNLSYKPSDATIAWFQNQITDPQIYRRSTRTVGSKNLPRQLSFAIAESSEIKAAMTDSAALSYLFYQDGKVVYDAMAAQDRFISPTKYTLDNETYFSSHSVGKSIISYMIGHAICEGYIDSLKSPIDWPYLADTVYGGQPLINLLNMRAGDSAAIGSKSSTMRISGRPFRGKFGLQEIKSDITGIKPVSNSYSYSNLAADVIANYLKYKVGADYNDFLQRFVNKLRLEDKLHVNRPYYADFEGDTGETYSILMTRYDYLRTAISMMDDWQGDTCVGQYLKEIYTLRQPKEWDLGVRWSDLRVSQSMGRSYGGFFTMDYQDLSGQTIIGMHGYGGQTIMMDMDNSRIVVINSGTRHYDKRALVYKPLKEGYLPQSR